MICPNCGANNKAGRTVCRECGFDFAEDRPRVPGVKGVARTLKWIGFVACMLAVTAITLYKGYYWFDAWRLSRLYEGGAMIEPAVETFTMDDGRLAHAVTFFADDGDTVFIPEMNCAYRVSGSLARVEIPDAHWFDTDPETAEAAEITFSPVLIKENGEKRALPPLTMTVDTPVSPLTLINPTGTYQTVYTSVFRLKLDVVAGSTVYVNGEDVTDDVDFTGYLDIAVNVYPQGDNSISILVDTPNHKQRREDIDLYRSPQDIRLEPSLELATTSNRDKISITGVIDPAATLSVDTPYVEGSVKVDADGKFSFMAKLTKVGDNTITFRASMAGKNDTVMSVNMYYVPTLKEYSDKAWAMDYDQLKVLTDVWEGRIFLCNGPVVDILQEGEKQIVIMNVGKDGATQLVALENLSTREPSMGATYRAYADVVKLYFYEAQNIPYLTARYMLLPN